MIGGTTVRRVVTFVQIAAFLIMLSGALPSVAQGGLYWEDNFENHLMPNWDTSACTSGVPPFPPDGCNGVISTDVARSGTHSLKSHFDAACGTDYINSLGCGSYYDRPHPGTREYWARFYQYTVNFTYYAATGTKLWYSFGTNQGFPEVLWIWLWGSRELGSQFVSEQFRDCPAGQPSPDRTCNYFPNMARVPLADNRWYCIEVHAKMNTGSTPNGVMEIFVDGVQTMGYYNLLMTQNDDTTQWTLWRHYAQYGQGDRYIDDLAIGNTRIGCSGVATPQPPTGLRTQ
jgi:hypothetical protein